MVAPPIHKEIHYFDLNFHRPLNWYLRHFPSKSALARTDWPEVRRTGEASPYYLYHPLVPQRIQRLLPEVKLLVVVRDPVDRAFSHYNHEVSRGHEFLAFEDAIDSENERLSGATKALESGALTYSYEHHHHSYLDRGLYAVQLARWFTYVERDRIKVLRFDDLCVRPRDIMIEIFEFLGIGAQPQKAYPIFNAGSYSEKIPSRVRETVARYFYEPNRELYQMTGINFNRV